MTEWQLAARLRRRGERGEQCDDEGDRSHGHAVTLGGRTGCTRESTVNGPTRLTDR